MHRVIISGGGTGGHIFPAIAIAGEIKRRYPDCKILFVGALGKMEMEKVPQAGYEIIGLPIAGIQRKMSFSNLWVPFKFLKSIWRARRIIREFNPDRVVGVGGYASSALIYAAARFRVPVLIQEQNSYAGLTNKWLASKAAKICVAYGNMEKFFPVDKIVITGNPVRKEIYEALNLEKSAAKSLLGFNPEKPVVLVIGGSLGARTINRSIQDSLEVFHQNGVQLLWQTGKNFKAVLSGLEGIKSSEFISDMKTAYAAADIVVSRAGAISVSELSLLNKPSILVPSPNVAEDHQTKNAVALSSRSAAILVSDEQAGKILSDEILNLVKDNEMQKRLKENLKPFAKPDALKDIVNVLETIA